jgi:hypothetical protein
LFVEGLVVGDGFPGVSGPGILEGDGVELHDADPGGDVAGDEADEGAADRGRAEGGVVGGIDRVTQVSGGQAGDG